MSSVITKEAFVSWVRLDKRLPPPGKEVLVKRMVADSSNTMRCDKVFYATFMGKIPYNCRIVELWATPYKDHPMATHWLKEVVR